MKIKILVFENLQEVSSMLLDKLAAIPDFDVHLRPTDNLTGTDGFDVALIDLELTVPPQGQSPLNEGIGVADRLRRANDRSAIIIYSGGMQMGTEANHPQYQNCLDVDPDAVVSRETLVSKPRRELEQTIRTWIKNRREKTQPGPVVSFEPDFKTSAFAESFEEFGIRETIKHHYREHAKVHVTAITAGYSGAAVIKISAASDVANVVSVQVVWKIARSRSNLSSEIQRLPDTGSQMAQQAALPDREIYSRNGLYYIVLPEVTDMYELRQFLLSPGLGQMDKTILSKFLDRALVDVAKRSLPLTADVAFKLNAQSAAKIAEFLEKAGVWSHVAKDPYRKALKAAHEYIKGVLNKWYSFPSGGKIGTRLHGDLHCRNIFVAAGRPSVLIDFGRHEVYPRFFDFAALDVDVMISVMDAIDGKDYDFRRLSSWLRRCARCYPFEKGSPKPAAATNKIDWLRFSIHQRLLDSRTFKASPKEYAECVMFHLLRYLRFPDIPAPKKVLAANLIMKLCNSYGFVAAP